jgi:phage-related holin
MNSEFSSRTAQNRLARKCALIIMLAGVAFVGTIYPHIQSLSSWVMFSFMLSELISIVRHGYTINTGEKLPEADIVKIITKQLFGQLSKFLPKETKKK